MCQYILVIISFHAIYSIPCWPHRRDHWLFQSTQIFKSLATLYAVYQSWLSCLRIKQNAFMHLHGNTVPVFLHTLFAEIQYMYSCIHCLPLIQYCQNFVPIPIEKHTEKKDLRDGSSRDAAERHSTARLPESLAIRHLLVTNRPTKIYETLPDCDPDSFIIEWNL